MTELKELVKKLLKEEKINVGVETFKISSIEKSKDGGYECELSRNNTKTKYSHAKKAETKSESVQYALEFLELMGYSLEE